MHDVTADLLLLLCDDDATRGIRRCVGRAVLPLVDLLPMSPFAAGSHEQEVWRVEADAAVFEVRVSPARNPLVALLIAEQRIALRCARRRKLPSLPPLIEQQGARTGRERQTCRRRKP